jgi:hypothetical protein
MKCLKCCQLIDSFNYWSGKKRLLLIIYLFWTCPHYNLLPFFYTVFLLMDFSNYLWHFLRVYMMNLFIKNTKGDKWVNTKIIGQVDHPALEYIVIPCTRKHIHHIVHSATHHKLHSKRIRVDKGKPMGLNSKKESVLGTYGPLLILLNTSKGQGEIKAFWSVNSKRNSQMTGAISTTETRKGFDKEHGLCE